MSINNPHKSKKSTRIGLRNISVGNESASDKARSTVAKRRFQAGTGGLGYLAACDFLGESALSIFHNA